MDQESTPPEVREYAAMQDPMQIALQHHQAGRLHEAGRIYQSVLARNPNEPDALHLLGLVVHQFGQH